MKAHTFVGSDFHLWAEFSQMELILEFFRELDCERFIDVGDFIEDDVVMEPGSPMDLQYQQIMACLVRLQQKNPPMEIIRIAGNHDDSGDDDVNKKLRIKTLKHYRWEAPNGKIFYFTHGHQWDGLLSKIFSRFFLWLQKHDTRKKFFTRLLDRLHGFYTGLSEKVYRGAVKFAHDNEIDVIFCGHAHELMDKVSVSKLRRHRVRYINCGHWTGPECSCFSMDQNGDHIESHFFYAKN